MDDGWGRGEGYGTTVAIRLGVKSAPPQAENQMRLLTSDVEDGEGRSMTLASSQGGVLWATIYVNIYIYRETSTHTYIYNVYV